MASSDDFSRQSLIPTFLYSSSSTKSLSLSKVLHSNPNPAQNSMVNSSNFIIPSPSEPHKIEMYSPSFYAACTAGGILSCGLTHMTITPLDLVKCNMQVVTDLLMAKDEIEKLKAESQANKDHMLQYKSIAQVNEAALKQMEVAHENFKIESEKMKESLEDQLRSLRDRTSELENELMLKSEELASATAGREHALASAMMEIATLKDERSSKISKIMALENQVSALKEDLEKEHQRWRSAQDNYKRQVVLQSETIKELTKTSEALAALQQQALDLRKLADEQKSENKELNAKWEAENYFWRNQKKKLRKNIMSSMNMFLYNILLFFFLYVPGRIASNSLFYM